MEKRKLRTLAMSLLYELEMLDYSEDLSVIQLFQSLDITDYSDKDLFYIDSVRNNYEEHKEQVDSLIRDNSKKWSFDRIAKVDLSILRLAITEILFIDDIPYRVSINEAVELAKEFSSDKSSAFINGILGSVIKQTIKK